MRTTINDQGYEWETLPPDESAVQLIRERCHLTGTKLACGAGVCGACTIHVDGQPVTSCLLPAIQLEGRQVETIEHYGTESLHPMQRAFMAHDALQCGFCTPGFLMSAIAFYDSWRMEHGPSTPPTEAVKEALAGHLCRCGAYPQIIEAVQAACAGEHDSADSPAPAARADALPKVTGAARYTVDIHEDDQLVGKILRSPHAHADVVAMDLSGAAVLPGVRAVVRMLGAQERVRYVGQELAAVAAVDEQSAVAALAAIRVTYRTLPAALTIEEALASDAPIIWERSREIPNASEGPVIPGSWDGNLRRPAMSRAPRHPQATPAIRTQKIGDAPTVQGHWRTPAQSHTPLEPHACVAHWHNEELTVHVSTQSCSAMAHEIAEHFGLAADKVTVLCPYIGGAFGSKLGLTGETIAAVRLAQATHTPVAVVLERPEEMTVGGYRPSAYVDLTLGATPTGELATLTAHAYANSGVAINTTVASLMHLVYRRRAGKRDLVDLDVVTNSAPGKPFRGPSGPVTCWSLEQAIDQMAHHLGRDPIALRRTWDDNSLRTQLYEWVEKLAPWQEREPAGRQTGRYRRGIGVAMGSWLYFYDPASEVKVESTASGLVVSTASQDMGNGTRSVLAGAVASVFGIEPQAVEVRVGCSQEVYGPRSGGSRTTNSLFAPARDAACQLRNQLMQAANAHFGLRNAQPGQGAITHAGGTLPWAEAMAQLPPQSATVKRGTDRLLDKLGHMVMPRLGLDLVIGNGLTSAAYVTELEVDTLLGKTRVRRVWAALAAGKIHVPVVARSQVQGGIIQGIGYALYEEKVLEPRTGAILSLGLEDYRVPGIGDTPEIEVHFIESGFDHAKGGGVGLSELATIPVAASVANAIFNATGWRPLEAPVQPARLLQGVQG